jgi:hypothetical protein
MNQRKHARLRAHQRARKVGKLWEEARGNLRAFAKLAIGHEITDWQSKILDHIAREMDRELMAAMMGGSALAAPGMTGTFSNMASSAADEGLTIEKLEEVCRKFAPPKRRDRFKSGPIYLSGLGGIIDLGGIA